MSGSSRGESGERPPRLRASCALASSVQAVTSAHVDIGLPVYNGARYIGLTLDSLLAQTHGELTIWISDNGSTDDTPAVVHEYAARDPRVRYERHEQNQGASWNFNYVRKFARHDYFKWTAHDDLYHPEYLARCVEVLEGSPDVIVAQPRTIFIDHEGQELLRSFRVNDWDHPRPAVRLRTALGRNHEYSFPFGLMRSAVAGEIEGFVGRYGADELLLADLAMRGRMVEVDEHLFSNRLHPHRSMVQNSGIRYRLLWNGFWGGAGGGGSAFPSWRFLRDLRGLVARAQLDDADRRECRAVVVEWARDNWLRLGIDVPLGVDHLVRSR
jgi:glycosyltransferase involved in cell wall biosynthesis